MRLIARPIESWPGKLLGDDIYRDYPQFSAAWSDTVNLLEREVTMLTERLRDPEVVLQLAVQESDLRLDGWIRASAKPAHPGAIVSFESRYGPLRYATDRFRGNPARGIPGWQANVRAIALGLEALRKVDRYGISKDGQQYRGWQALPPGVNPDAPMTVDDAARFIARWADTNDDKLASVAAEIIDRPGVRATLYRQAASRLHPDVGGDPALFRRLTDARNLIEAAQ